MITIEITPITQTVWKEEYLKNVNVFLDLDIPAELTEATIKALENIPINELTDDRRKNINKFIIQVMELSNIRKSDDFLIDLIDEKNAIGTYKEFSFEFKAINPANKCKCLFRIKNQTKVIFSEEIALSNGASINKYSNDISEKLNLSKQDIKSRLLNLGARLEVVISDFINKNASSNISNKNKKFPHHIYIIDPPKKKYMPDSENTPSQNIYGGEYLENDNLKEVTKNIKCIEEITDDKTFLKDELYDFLKEEVLKANSNLTYSLPFDVSWIGIRNVMSQLFEDTGKLVFVISNNKTVKGRIVSISGDYPKNISLVSKVETTEGRGEDATATEEIICFADSLNKNQTIINTYFSQYYTHIFTSEYGGRFFLLSKTKLEPQYCSVSGMLINTSDLSIIGETRKFSVGLPVLFVQNVEPDIVALTPEKYLECVKKYDHEILMKTIAGAFRHPLWFEKLTTAFLFSFEHGMYALNLFLMAQAGTGKSSYLDALNCSYMEEKVFSGTASTLKGLVPNFASSPPNEGYIARCRRLSLIDEFLRLLGDERRHETERVDTSLGMMNDILEHKTRSFCSGKGSINVKATAKAFIATNPVHGTNNLVDLAKKMDKPFLSRFILYAQNEQHVKFINDNKENVATLGDSAYPKHSFELISMTDYLTSIPVKMPKGVVSRLFKLYIKQVPEPLQEVYKARYEHHIECLLDGLVKYHAILRHDANFSFKDEVDDVIIKDAEEILGEVIASWSRIDDIKNIPQKIRKHYLKYDHRLVYDIVEQSSKITEKELTNYVSEDLKKNIPALVMELRNNFDIVKVITFEGVDYLAPHWYNLEKLKGAKSEENIDISILFSEWMGSEEKKKMDAEEEFGEDFIKKQLEDGIVLEFKSGMIKKL